MLLSDKSMRFIRKESIFVVFRAWNFLDGVKILTKIWGVKTKFVFRKVKKDEWIIGWGIGKIFATTDDTDKMRMGTDDTDGQGNHNLLKIK